MAIIKTKSEIKKIEQACKITLRILDCIERMLRKGMTEKDIEKIIKELMQKENVKPAFSPIVAFGNNATTLHHKPTNRKLGKGFLLLDIGARYKGYCSDISRMLYFSPPMRKDEQKVLCNVIEMQQLLIDMIHPGVHAGNLQKTYRGMLKKNGHRVPHSFGHSLGKSPHDRPRLRKQTVLKPGMVITIEPGVYIRRGKNRFGVRIEDDIVVTKKGCRILSK